MTPLPSIPKGLARLRRVKLPQTKGQPAIAPATRMSRDDFMAEYIRHNELKDAARLDDCIVVRGQLMKPVACDCTWDECPGWIMMDASLKQRR